MHQHDRSGSPLTAAEADEIGGAVVAGEQQKCEGTGAESLIAAIESPAGVAFARRFVERAAVAKDVCGEQVRVGALRPPRHERARLPQRAERVATLRSNDD